MLKEQNVITNQKSNKNRNNIHKRRKIKEKKIKIKFKKLKRLSKKIYYKRKRKQNSEDKTILTDFTSEEINDNSIEYKNELIEIINQITNKYNINHSISENNINEKIDNIISEANKNKINIILDIDQTLVYSQRINNEKDKMKLLNNNTLSDNHFIEFYLENKKYIYYIQVRNGLQEFISNLSPYCNFYVNTMANPIYIKSVLNLLNQKYNLNLYNGGNGASNVFITYQKERKTLPPEITKDGNFLILDDNICAWDKTYLANIIPVRKYYGSFNNINSDEISFDTIYQYYFFKNKIYCFNEQKREFYDLNNKLPFCSEASWSDNKQLNDISKLIIKVYLLNKLLNIPVNFSFFNIINNILNDCKIFYDGEDKYFIDDLIILLGGKLMPNINDATYVLIKENNYNFVNKFKNSTYNYINIKWLFDTFFSFIKCKIEKYYIK